MTQKLLIFFGEAASRVAQVCLCSEQGMTPLEPGEALGSVAEGTEAIAVLAGEDVSSWRLELPEMPDAKLMQILPSQLEDLQASRAEGDHVALLGRGVEDSGAARLVASVKGSVLEAAIDACRALGVDPQAVVPDYALVPAGDAARYSAFLEDGRRSVRLPDGTGFAGDKILCDAVAPDALAFAGKVDCETVEAVVSRLNLLQGRFKPRIALVAFLPLMRRSLFLLAAIALTWGIGAYITAQNKLEAATALQAQAEQAFRQAFPDVTRIVDVELQAQRQVAMKRAGQGGHFLRLSRYVFAAVNETPGALVESVRYNEAQAAYFLSVSFASFGESDAFRASLAGQGLRVTEGGSRQDDGRIITDLAIEVTP